MNFIGGAIGGAGVGLAVAFGGLLWLERGRAAELQELVFAETLARYDLAAKLGTCQATRDALREGKEIDNAIPDDLGTFRLPDRWWLQPEAAN